MLVKIIFLLFLHFCLFIINIKLIEVLCQFINNLIVIFFFVIVNYYIRYLKILFFFLWFFFFFCWVFLRVSAWSVVFWSSVWWAVIVIWITFRRWKENFIFFFLFWLWFSLWMQVFYFNRS